MTIEFNCRICHATIHVPDKAAGGKGRCPKCGLRITVPKKSPPKSVAKSPGPEEQFVLPGVTDVGNVLEGPSTADDSDSVVMLEPVGFQPDDLTAASGAFALERPMAAPSVRSSARRLKRTSSPFIMAGLFILALLTGAAFFLYPMLTAERISGELTAGAARTLELPPVLIDKSRIKLPSDQLDGLLKKLESSPIPLTSSSMQIELSGSSKGLQISVTSTSQSYFYRVSFTRNKDIQQYLDKHFADFEDQRQSEVDQTATNFFLEYQKVIDKKSTSDKIASFRDSLAIPALVRGFGNFLVAEYGRGLYRCVYEDHDGGLYFLLPAEVQSFKIVGRHGSDDRPLVPVEFQVKVEGEIVLPNLPIEKASPKPANPKSKPAKKVLEMSDEESDGKK